MDWQTVVSKVLLYLTNSLVCGLGKTIVVLAQSCKQYKICA